MMRSAILLVSVLVAATGVPAAEVPEIRYRANPSSVPPLWVPAQAVIDERGDLRPALLSLSAFGRGRQYQEWDTTFRIVPDSDCREVMAIPIACGGASKPDHTVEHLFEHAIGIYHGRIVALSYGFYSGKAGVLFRAAPVEVLRGTDAIDLEHDLVIFHHYARFAVGGRKFCTGLSRAPEVGDEFVVFAYHEPSDESGSIIYAGDRIFFESPSGALETLSPKYDLTRFPSLDSMVAAIRSTAWMQRRAPK
jgi:hypothetical protein